MPIPEHMPDFIQALTTVNNLTKSGKDSRLKDKEIEDTKKDGAS